MDKNSGNFPNLDLQKAMALANSDAAKQLFALLQSGDMAQLQAAMALATAGDMESAKQILAPMMASPQVQALLRQLQGEQNG